MPDAPSSILSLHNPSFPSLPLCFLPLSISPLSHLFLSAFPFTLDPLPSPSLPFPSLPFFSWLMCFYMLPLKWHLLCIYVGEENFQPSQSGQKRKNSGIVMVVVTSVCNQVTILIHIFGSTSFRLVLFPPCLAQLFITCSTIFNVHGETLGPRLLVNNVFFTFFPCFCYIFCHFQDRKVGVKPGKCFKRDVAIVGQSFDLPWKINSSCLIRGGALTLPLDQISPPSR